jgi:hypothetical protein
MEVTLIDEAEIGGDGSDRLPSREAALCFLETHMAKISVHRNAITALETPRELKSTHRRERRELAHRHRSLQAVMQVVAYASHCRIVIARKLGWMDNPPGQRTQASNEQLIGGERIGWRC